MSKQVDRIFAFALSEEDIFGFFPHLELLDLRNNSLSGPFPRSICSLQFLKRLGLSLNLLSGSIDCLGEAQALSFLGLSHNRFTGGLPDLSRLQQLQTVYLQDNQLSGRIPSDWAQLIQLQCLLLSKNRLEGSIPSSLGQLPRLTRLELSSNLLEGTIPESFSGLESLTELYLSQNRLEGQLPSIFHGLQVLEKLDLSENRFHGDLAVCEARSLLSLSMNDNQLSSIPSCIRNLKGLELLLLARNAIKDADYGLRQLTNLQVLDLEDNQLTELWPLMSPSLRRLNCNGNRLKQGLSMDIFGAAKELVSFQVARNRLTGLDGDLCAPRSPGSVHEKQPNQWF